MPKSLRSVAKRSRPKPTLPYWACLALWATLGPLGAAPAACGRWSRACLEAALTLGGLALLSQGFAAALRSDDPALSLAVEGASMGPVRAISSAVLLCMAMGLWVSDFWRMKAWHGKRADPLLDPTTTSTVAPAEPR